MTNEKLKSNFGFLIIFIVNVDYISLLYRDNHLYIINMANNGQEVVEMPPEDEGKSIHDKLL